MDWTAVLSFTFVAALLVMSPGPNGILIAKTVPTSGKTAGFANIAGFFTAFYVHGALSILGISFILVQSAQAFFIVKMLGAVYLCWVGFKALREAYAGAHSPKQIEPAKRRRTLTKAFVEGFLTNALNPKVAIFYLAAFPQFITVSNNIVPSPVLQSLLLVVIHSLLSVAWFSLVVLVFARISKNMRKNSVQRWFKGVIGAVFVGFGLKLATLRTS